MAANPVRMIDDLWRRLGGSAAGRWLFSRLVGRAIPYSSTIGARVETLETGKAVVVMRDRKKVRNHLASIHAVALANLLELTTGLAFNVSLPDGVRAIVTRFEIEYLKKARGTLTASCVCEPPGADEERSYRVDGEAIDESGEIVARATAHWRVRPEPR